MLYMKTKTQKKTASNYQDYLKFCESVGISDNFATQNKLQYAHYPTRYLPLDSRLGLCFNAVGDSFRQIFLAVFSSTQSTKRKGESDVMYLFDSKDWKSTNRHNAFYNNLKIDPFLITKPRCCRVGRSASPFLVGHLDALCFGDRCDPNHHWNHPEAPHDPHREHPPTCLPYVAVDAPWPNPKDEGLKYSNIHFFRCENVRAWTAPAIPWHWSLLNDPLHWRLPHPPGVNLDQVEGGLESQKKSLQTIASCAKIGHILNQSKWK